MTTYTVRDLSAEDRESLLSTAYERERENVFIISALEEGSGFEGNRFFGIDGTDASRGIGAYFGRWHSFVGNGSDPALRALADEAIRLRLPIEAVPAFRAYSLPLIDQLRVRGLHPKSESDEIVYEMTQQEFQTHDTANVRPATENDIEICARFDRGKDLNEPATDLERSRVQWNHMMLVEIDGVIVAKANLHGHTKRYAQIGGVFTHPDHRGKGYAKKCVSALCEDCFERGTERMLLFTDVANAPARAVYEKLGFQPVDRFVIAEY